MYRFNPLNRFVLITPEEVLYHMPSDQDVDARQIMQNIIIAEERFISPALCDEFYRELVEMKNRKVTEDNKAEILALINAEQAAAGLDELSEDQLPVGSIINAIEFVEDTDYVELWNRLLWKVVAECVDYMAIVPSWLRHTSSGQMMNNPKVIGASGATSGADKDVLLKMKSAMEDRIDPLLERMFQYLCQNKELFPKFCKDCGSCGCDGEAETPDGISYQRKSGFVTGLYDDQDYDN